MGHFFEEKIQKNDSLLFLINFYEESTSFFEKKLSKITFKSFFSICVSSDLLLYNRL